MKNVNAGPGEGGPWGWALRVGFGRWRALRVGFEGELRAVAGFGGGLRGALRAVAGGSLLTLISTYQHYPGVGEI